jgi:hypothetical protein
VINPWEMIILILLPFYPPITLIFVRSGLDITLIIYPQSVSAILCPQFMAIFKIYVENVIIESKVKNPMQYGKIFGVQKLKLDACLH